MGVHVIHVVGSVVNLLQEVLQLLDEDALLEPLIHSRCQTRAGFFPARPPRIRVLPGCLFDDVLEEDEPCIQSSLYLLQEEEDLLII